jgi:hypothetical protein
MNDTPPPTPSAREALAARLNGREYGEETTPADEKAAKDAGLVIVFGASDDLMEFRGAVNDEVGAYNGGGAFFTCDGLLKSQCSDEECPYFAEKQDAATFVEAKWTGGDFPWTYETAIPHSTFEIVEDGEKYCRGIVFALADVPKEST